MKILQPVHKRDDQHFLRAVCRADGPKALAQPTGLVTCKACLQEMRAQMVERALDDADTVDSGQLIRSDYKVRL